MIRPASTIVVAGHICLDVIPTFEQRSYRMEELAVPGKLNHVGPAILSTGGAVSNTGLALHRLGMSARLVGKVGDDIFGEVILRLVRDRSAPLAEGMITAPGEHTSYTIVISPPGVDRVFFHCPGANDTFSSADINDAHFRDARMFHFGYPPIMRRMFADGGIELADIMQRARCAGLITSLDMAFPDPDSEAGRVDWRALLEHVLPHVDLFLPSFDEVFFMLHRKRFERYSASRAEQGQIESAWISDVASQLLDMGTAVVGLKLGDQGFYVRTRDETRRLGLPSSWGNRERLVPCFQVDALGTTGAGDCTIAGFLAGLAHGQELEHAMQSAVATGAFSVQSADGTGGIPSWSAVQERIEEKWSQKRCRIDLSSWQRSADGLYYTGDETSKKESAEC